MHNESFRRCRHCGRATRHSRDYFDLTVSGWLVWLRPVFAFAEWLGNPWVCLECPRVVPKSSALPPE
jgi:hypothetical protein